MRAEIRVYNIDLIDDIILLKPDIISIGDDYCPWKLRSIKNYVEISKKVIEAGMKFRLVTSFVPGNSFDEINKMIDKISEISDEIEFVINDYGVLSYLKSMGKLPKNVIIGQMLNHSLEEYLWSKEMISEEELKVKDNWLLSNYANKMVIDYFKENYNLRGIIINCLPYGQKSAEIIQSNGVEVNFVEKLYTMAVARKCHCAKFYNKTPGQKCESLCNECFRASLNQVYKIGTDDIKYGIPNDDVKNRVQDWIIFGNAIYHKYPDDLNLDIKKYENATMIINQRYYNNVNDIAKALDKYREGNK